MVILTQIIKTIVYHTNDGSSQNVLDHILGRPLNDAAGRPQIFYSRIASLTYRDPVVSCRAF